MSVKRIVLTLVIAAFVIFSGVMFHQISQWANQPVSKAVEIKEEKDKAPAKPPGDQDLITNFFSTKVPDNFKIQTSDIPVAEKELIQVVAYENNGGGSQIGIRSNVMPASGLKGIGDYNYRLKTPELYGRYGGKLPVHSYGFVKNDGTEITIFLTKGGRYASVSVTVKGDPVKLQDLVNKTMNYWAWNNVE